MAEKSFFRTKLCEEVLIFPTHKCKNGHICILEPLHTLAIAPEDRKHMCKCGVKWTKDAEVAKGGKEWTEAGVIYDGSKRKKEPTETD